MVKPGYKQTEVGVIPENWDVKPAKNLMKIETGSRNTEHKTDYGQYPFFVRSQQVEHIDSYHYDCEAVLTAGDGVGTGKVFHYIDGKFDAHQRVYVMSNFDGVLGKYFFYFFGKNFGAEVSKYTAKSSVDSVRRDMIAEMLIPVPAEDEQRCIYEAIFDAEKLIGSLEKQIAKKKAIKQGAMQELLTGKKRLPGFSGEWQHSCLGEAAELSTTTISSKLIDSRYYVGTDNMVANRGGVMENEIILTYANIREYKVGDVLISNIRPYLKKIWYATRNGGCSNDVLVIRRKNSEELDSVFLYYILATDAFFDEIMAYAVGTKMPRGDKLVIKSYKICFPKDIFEQQAIAEILSNMDSEIEALEQKLAKYHQIKQGMMQQLLTGKIRLV